MSDRVDFGHLDIPIGDKQRRVDDVFRRVAHRYDVMNDIMSVGLHRVWKNALIGALNLPRRDEVFTILDVAGGTGDIALRAVTRGGQGTEAVVCDINLDMLAVGRSRVEALGLDRRIRFTEGNAEALPFASSRFDAVTIAFGIRNVPRIDQALMEAHRVLRIGGRFLCLEFSPVDTPGLDAAYDFYSYNVIPWLGRMVAGDAGPYRYLVESIRRFPRPEPFADMMRKAGFRRVSYRQMSGGIVVLHSGWRL